MKKGGKEGGMGKKEGKGNRKGKKEEPGLSNRTYSAHLNLLFRKVNLSDPHPSSADMWK